MADLFEVEAIRGKFESLISQMRFVLFRSAYSSLMRESRDCSFAILSPEGESPFPAPRCFTTTGRRVRSVFPLEEIRDGDMFIGNNPYQMGMQHLPDILVMSPVFYEGQLVAFSASMAHKMDIGGAVPGSIYSGASEMFQEGLVLPLMKYYDRGRLITQIDEMIRFNVRNPDVVLGDLGAQVGATLRAVAETKAIVAKYGAETVLGAFEELLAIPQRRASKIIETWPGKVAEAEAWLDPPPNHDKPVRLHVRVTRQEGHLTFDFSGSDPQVRSTVNVVTPYVLGTLLECLSGMVDPIIPDNAGLARACTVTAKEGTVMSPVPPAPTGNTTMVNPRLAELIVSALATLKGQGPVAERGGHGTTAFGWRTGLVTGRTYVQYEIQNGAGVGASSLEDGFSSCNPHSYAIDRQTLDTRGTLDAPIEILESGYPVLVKRFELIPDSGGPGKFRGGAARRKVYEAKASATFNVRHSAGFVLPPQGVAGGKPGRKGRVVINEGKPDEFELESWWHESVRPGDTVAFEAAGGGGAGDPFHRDPQRVLSDVLDGLVSVEGALGDYGVALANTNGRLSVDGNETKRLRSSPRPRLTQAPR